MGSHLETAHPTLEAAARSVCESLSAFGESLDRHDNVDHEQHGVFVSRGERLATHLRAALVLAEQNLFASALALLRTSLEHHLTDRLLQEGPRFQSTTVDPVSDDSWAALQEEWGAQETRRSRSWAMPPDRNQRNRVTFTFRGMATRDDDPATTADLLSPLYFEMERYSPTMGRPDHQLRFDDGLMKLEHRVTQAQRNRDTWKQWVSWDALRRLVEINEFFDRRSMVALDVHYGFLSGFVHATQAGYTAAYGMPRSISADGAHDISEELVHLYVAAIGAAELRVLCRMEERPPPVRISGRADVEALCDIAESESSHLWFAGGTPHQYDVATEWNRRTWRRHRDEGASGWPVRTDPPRSDEIPYPGESPDERLRKMHLDWSEMTTGVSYKSPWPAFRRW